MVKVEVGSQDMCSYCEDQGSDFMYSTINVKEGQGQEVVHIYFCSDCDRPERVPDHYDRIDLEEFEKRP